MFKVNIIVEDSKWRKEIPTIEKMLKKNVKKIYSSIDRTSQKKNLEISVLLTNKTKMKKLNKDFRRILKDTDVLSFPHHEKNFFLKKNLTTMNNIYLVSSNVFIVLVVFVVLVVLHLAFSIAFHNGPLYYLRSFVQRARNY